MKQLKVICTFVLAVSIFVAQGLQIHSHAYAHGPEQTDHVHQSTVHFYHMVEQSEAHPDESAPIKAAKDSVVKHNSFAALLGVLSTAVFAHPRSLLLLESYVKSVFGGVSHFDLGLAPPLRAPPL
jgi:hypothetical protein